MDKESILKKYNDPGVRYIYGSFYGRPWDDFTYIEKEKLKLSYNAFVFIWGGPGPDYNVYKFSDYGITWAFTKEEIE